MSTHRVSKGASLHHRQFSTALRARCGAVCLLGVLLLLAACGRAQQANPTTHDSFAVTLATDPAPPVMGDAAVVVTLHDAAGQPVDGARLAVEANMSHAGMVPVMGHADAGQGGVYRVPLQWTMAGDWYVDVKFTLPDGQIVTRRFPVTVQAK
jgi:hypothetical protein